MEAIFEDLAREMRKNRHFVGYRELDGVTMAVLHNGGESYSGSLIGTVADQCTFLSMLYQKIKAGTPPYSDEEVSDFERRLGVVLPALLRHYMLNISRSSVLEQEFQIDIDADLGENLVTDEDIERGFIEYKGCTAIEDGLLVIRDNEDGYMWSGVVLEGAGAGLVLVWDGFGGFAGKPGWVVKTLWEVLRHPCADGVPNLCLRKGT